MYSSPQKKHVAVTLPDENQQAQSSCQLSYAIEEMTVEPFATCCCWEVETCSAFVIFIGLASLALKYLLLSLDPELHTLLVLGNADYLYDNPLISYGILIIQFLVLGLFALSLFTNIRLLAYPYIFYQAFLIGVETYFITVLIIFSAIGKLFFMQAPARILIESYISEEFARKSVRAGDTFTGLIVVVPLLILTLTNIFILTILKRYARLVKERREWNEFDKVY